MERTLYNRNGDAVAYITSDYNKTIYMFNGQAVAYLYENSHVYGINGRHLGWFVDDIIFNHHGERTGFTNKTCPVNVAKEPIKSEKSHADELRPRWAAPPFPNLNYDYAVHDLKDLLKDGLVIRQQV